MRYISVFSGIEAASVAWSPLGWEPLAFSEIDPFPSAVLAARFPDVPNLGDITKIDWSSYAGAADVVVGGSPCQSFSIAGKREGLAGASGLMWEYIRAVRELRPRFFVWENVPGALSSSHGEDFGCLLRSLDDLGYGVAWRVLDAKFFGVAQRRRRVFLVGCLGDPERAAEILFEPDCLRWDTPSSREKRKELAGASGSGARGDCYGFVGHHGGNTSLGVDTDVSATPESSMPSDVCYALRMRQGKPGGGKGPLVQTDVSGTLATGNDQTIFQPICMASAQANAEIGHDLSHVADGTPMVPYDGLMWTVRRLMPVECERLQGFTAGWTDIPWRGKDHAPDGPRYKAIGNSMCVQVMRWIGERIADAAVACAESRWSQASHENEYLPIRMTAEPQNGSERL